MSDHENEFFWLMTALFIGSGKASCSYAQRTLGIKYNQAAANIGLMEAHGIVSRPNNVGKREILVSKLSEARERFPRAIACLREHDLAQTAAPETDLLIAAEALMRSSFAEHYRLISPFKELGEAIDKARDRPHGILRAEEKAQ